MKIGLCAIVKNEESIITRCLDSAKSLIDYVSIVDTGSSDNTVKVIEQWLIENKIEGKVFSEETKRKLTEAKLLFWKLKKLNSHLPKQHDFF